MIDLIISLKKTMKTMKTLKIATNLLFQNRLFYARDPDVNLSLSPYIEHRYIVMWVSW